MSGTYPIVGIQDGIGPNGERPLRYEINKFVDPKHNPYAKDQLNLFLLALEKIQAMSHTERLSWFQIAGIHGQPFTDWDGSKGIDSDPDRWGGYCTHASILFPTWHRVYHALIEQAVHECMKNVLAEFPRDKQAALKPAVDHWRYPYWDWALVKPGTTDLVVPELMGLPKIEIQRPNGVTQTIDNPLYRYRFPLDAQSKVIGFTGGPPYTEAPYTVRHPAPFDNKLPVMSQETWAKGISDNDAVQTALNDISGQLLAGRQLVVSVYQLFAMIRSFPPFSNTSWREPGNPRHYTSLEGIHNNVHVIIGGLSYGHMAINDFATFDAAFWMHHGNVERQLSIFQALNPSDYKDWPNDSWLRNTVRPWFDDVLQLDNGGTWTRPPYTEETTNTPLTPFHKDAKGTVYDSDGCRYITNFGYAFEELQDWLPKYRDASGKFNTPLYCQDIRKALSEKYGWAMPSHHTVSHLAAAHPHRAEMAATGVVLASTGHQHQYKEYVVNVLVDRFANNGETFVVDLFLGEVPDDVSSWETSANKLGMVAIFGGTQFMSGNCANCEKQAAHQETRLVTGQVPITTTLMDLIESGKALGGEALQSLEKNDVAGFLKRNLHWRIVKIGNTELPLSECSSLKVSVAVATATLPSAEGELVQYGEFEVIDEPTVGRIGGYDSRKDKV